MTSILWLSWDIGAGDGGLSRQSAGLAGQLAADGHDVVVVTRQAERAPRSVGAARCVRAAEPPPIMTWQAGGRMDRALAFATPAVARIVRELDRPPEVVVADGWQAGLVGRALATMWPATFVQVVPGLEVRRRALGDVPDQDTEHVAAIEAATAAAADLVLARGPDPADVAAAFDLPADAVVVLPFGVALDHDGSEVGADVAAAEAAEAVAGDPAAVESAADASRSDRGLAPTSIAVLPPRGMGDDWTDALAALLGAGVDVLDLRRVPWPSSPPDIVVVHDVERGDVAIAAAAEGIPVVVADLPELTTPLRHVVAAVVAPTPDASAEAVAGLPPRRDAGRRPAAQAALAALASSGNGWPQVAAGFHAALARDT